MSFLNEILGQASENATVQNLAAKVGLTPEQVEQAITALGQAHSQEGDTVQGAADETGLPTGKLQEIVEHMGGEGSLGRFATILDQAGGVSGVLGGLSKYL